MKMSTAPKFSEKLSGAPRVMAVVTKDDLQRFGGITLREILERVPGLAGATASFTGRSLIAARGDQAKINGGHTRNTFDAVPFIDRDSNEVVLEWTNTVALSSSYASPKALTST